MTILIRIGIALVLLVVLAVLALALRRGDGGEPLTQRMAPCPDKPNCVSSRASDERHRIEPLAADGDPAEAFRRAAEAVRALPRTRIVTEEAGYLHVECVSRLFRFIDDLELELDADAGVIHVRSASRVGHSDLGVNRKRVERVRAALR